MRKYCVRAAVLRNSFYEVHSIRGFSIAQADELPISLQLFTLIGLHSGSILMTRTARLVTSKERFHLDDSLSPPQD